MTHTHSLTHTHRDNAELWARGGHLCKDARVEGVTLILTLLLVGGVSRFLGETLCPSLNTAYLLFHNMDRSLTPFLPRLSPGESSSTSLMRDIVGPDVLHYGLTCWIHMKKCSWILCPSKLWAHTSAPVPPLLLQLPHQQLVSSPLTFTSL